MAIVEFIDAHDGFEIITLRNDLYLTAPAIGNIAVTQITHILFLGALTQAI